MNRNPQNNKITSKAKRLLIFAASFIIAAALAVTCGLCFNIDPARRESVDDVESGTVQQTANHTAPTSGVAVSYISDLIKAGQLGVGNYIDFTYNGGFYYVTLPAGFYIQTECWGAASSNGNRGGYAKHHWYFQYAEDVNICVGGTNGYNGGVGGGGGASHVCHINPNKLLKDCSYGNLVQVGGGGGTSSASVSTNSTYGQGSSGGGGGFYGGASGYAGSSWNNTSAWGFSQSSSVTHSVLTPNVRSGNGLVRVTILSISSSAGINAVPAQVTKSYTNQKLTVGGSNAKLTVKSTDFASDAHGVYFMNSASDLTGYTGAKMYLDAACSSNKTADDYFTYSFSNNQTLNITEFKKLPRADDGKAAQNNKIRIYMRVRDNYSASVSGPYNGSTQTITFGPAHTVRYFDISYANVAASKKDDTSGNLKNGNTYAYKVGASTTQNGGDAFASGAIYSSKAVGTWSLCVLKPIQKGDKLKVTAAELMGVTGPSGVDTSKFKAYIVPSAATTSIFTYSGTTTALHTGNGSTSVNGYAEITINAVGAAPSWQNITFTLYIVEINSIKGTNSNYEPIGITYASNIRTLDVNFLMDNTRPVLKDGANNVVSVGIGATSTVNLNDYFYDRDGSISTGTHSITAVKVPDKEFVQIDKYGNVVNTAGKGGAATNSSYYNIGGSLATALADGTSDTPTGFKSNIAVPQSATQEQANEAFLRYSYTGVTLSLTGLRPSYSQYNRSGSTAYTGGTTASPSGASAVANPGHFYLLIQVKDNNEPTDTGIWLPIAVTVGATDGLAPVNTGSSTGSVSGQGVVSAMPYAEGNAGAGDASSFYFVPMAVNIGGTQNPVAAKVVDNGTEIDSSRWQPLALDGDNFTTTTGTASWSGKLNEFVTITSSASDVQNSILSSVSSVRITRFATVSEVDVYIPITYFGGRVAVGSVAGSDNATGVNTIKLDTVDGTYYKTRGLKITLESPTMNRYFYATVNLADSRSRALSVEIAIKVNNSDPQTSATAATFTSTAGVGSTYDNGGVGGVPTLTYKVPMHSTFMLTPYDLVTDINLTEAGAAYPAGGFTLNGLAGKYAGGKFTVGGTAAEGEIAVHPLFDTTTYGGAYADGLQTLLTNLDTTSTATKLFNAKAFGAATATTAVPNDRLFFVRNSDTASDAFTFAPTGYDSFTYAASFMDGYIDYLFGNKIVFANGVEKDLDFVLFSATTRTPRSTEFTMTVRDRYGNSSITVCVKIDVINTPPVMKENLKATELAVTPVTGGSVTLNSATVHPTDVMTDMDGDDVTFMLSRGIVVARGAGIAFTDFATDVTDPDINKLLYDDDGHLLTDYYLSASLDSANDITVTAIGSTKNIKEGVFVYFFASDPRGGIALGYKQIEVVNTAPVFNNSSENGFATADRLWSIESTSTADTSRPRYIAGSQKALGSLRTDTSINAAAIDVRLIATDADALQGVLLSQRGSTATSYVNYGAPTLTDASVNYDYEDAVPDVVTTRLGFSNDAPSAVWLFKRTQTETGEAIAAMENVTPTLMFLVKSEWYTRDELIAAIAAGTDITADDCFDGEGRFTVKDWALRIVATNPFLDGGKPYNLGITFALRDEARYGGDTAGLATAYDSDRSKAQTAVSGTLGETVYMYISNTGIITKDEFSKYENYYVADGNDGKHYVITKNGTTLGATEYTAAAATAGIADAYKYPSTITVPGNSDGSATYDTVYVPMSYFGLSNTLASPDSTTHKVTYQDSFVSYDVRTGNNDVTYDRGNILSIERALTISDGVTSWGGSSGRKLADNPYVTVNAVNYAVSGTNMFGSGISASYFNGLLSVPNVGFNDPAYTLLASDNVLYLDDQASKLPEHQFGLTFTKKSFRTGVNNLTFTVKLALAADASGADINTTTAVNSDSKNVRSVSVAISVGNSPIDIVSGRSVDVAGTADPSGKMLNYDDEKGTYYTEVELTTSQTASYLLVRDGGDSDPLDALNRTYRRIYYTDRDVEIKDARSTSYRDYAYFASDSIIGLSASQAASVKQLNDDGDAFINTVVKDDARAQSSVLNYYGVKSYADVAGASNARNGGVHGYNSYFSASMAENSRAISISASRRTDINLTALPGIVDTLKLDPAYSSEFSTFGSWDDQKTYGGLSYKQLYTIYETRGFVLSFSSASASNSLRDSTAEIPDNEVLSAYYPLKVLIYDNRGAGFDKASYVAMEFRISISNTAPTIKSGVGKRVDGKLEYGINLASGDSLVLNLYDFVNDPDIMVMSSGDVRMLATESDFLASSTSQLVRETGDYLESVYKYAYSSYADAESIQAALLGGSLGVTSYAETRSDVVMYAETSSSSVNDHTIPLDTKLWFKVNRRTTDANGVGIDEFRFTLAFRDNHGAEFQTESITFVVSINNQAPTITTTVRDITMHANDTFTVLPAYYDTFIGGSSYIQSDKQYEAVKDGSGAINDLPKEGSPAYLNSLTYGSYYYKRRTPSAFDYSKITSDVYDLGATGNYAFKNVSTEIGGVDLGYLGLATDDAPWKMRFANYSDEDVSSYLRITPQNLTKVEGTGGSSYGNAIALSVTAVRACNRLPVTFTIMDGENGGIVSYTLNVTIISTPPQPRDAGNTEDSRLLSATKLEGIKTSDTSNVYEKGVYRTFIIPSGDSNGVPVNLENIGGSGAKTAYKDVKITLKNVATDIDGQSQIDSMSLYNGGMFAVNGVAMKSDPDASDGRLVSDYFYITTENEGRAFTIHATGYDMYRNFEELTFYIADSGNNVFENTCSITIQVYTVYSDMTNPTVAAASSADYNAYLGGANEVHVKSYDEFIGLGDFVSSPAAGVSSEYAFLDLDGSDGTDGNEGKSPIVDPDVSVAGAQSYATDIYAFINNDGTPLTPQEIDKLLVRNTKNKTFAIRSDKKEEANAYRIGGITANGSVVAPTDRDKLDVVNRYVTFSLAMDGASISFIPNTATLDTKIMMYVEVQKRLGTRRTVLRTDDSAAAGSLFRLVVNDSAPIAVNQTGREDYFAEFTGTKGSVGTFKIFDRNDISGSLFSDSDIDDTIEIRGFSATDATDNSYREALKKANAPESLDWSANGVQGKERAFTIAVDNAAGTLSITINRRMDEIVRTTDESGKQVVKYKESVSFPILIEGYDSTGKKDETIIRITVVNSPVSAKENYSTQSGGNNSVGYSFVRNFGSAYDNEYILDARVVYGSDLTIRLDDFILDNDYIKNTNNDSFVLVEGSHRVSYSYLTDKPLKAVFYEDELYGEPIDLATVTPLYDGNGSGAQLRYYAITIHAETTLRECTGSVYLCVMDRSSDTTYAETGVYIQLNVTVVNDAPYVLDGMDGTTESILGSDNATAEKSFRIGNYVNDNNETDYADMTKDGVDLSSTTYLRIYSVTYLDYSEIWSTPAANIGSGAADDSSLLFEVSYESSDTDDRYNQTFVIKPKVGFYGTGEVEIMICDGNINVNSDTEFTSFRIKVNVVYNPDDIAAFNGISTARGKTRTITIESLIPDVDNTFEGVGARVENRNNGGIDSVMPSKNVGSFNPSAWYVLKSVTLSEEAKDYAEITQTSESEWSLHALVETASAKRVNIAYALKSDMSAEYTGYFLLNVTANLQPVLLSKNMTFERYPADDDVNVMYHLNTNNTVFLNANQLFSDPEDDELKLISVKSNKPSLVSASLVHDGEDLAIRFTARGSAEITVTVADETGKNYSYVITVNNNDLEAPSLWTRLLASFESNKVMWAIIIGVVILAIIILIIVIAVVRKRKRAREELEALLVSEMEIEEQMLKLAGGPSPTGYQSYGYLQSAPGQTVDPNMLLGTGTQAPNPNVPELALPPTPNDASAQQQGPSPDNNTNPYDGM